MDRNRKQEGFAAIGLIIVLGPLLFLVTSYLQTMSGRSKGLQFDYLEERALLAAESGVDVAIYEARRGTLVAGHLAQFTFNGTLPSGDGYQAIATYLGDDDLDNDGDLVPDEPDEDVFRVESTGTSGKYRRRVATYLGFSSFLTAPTAAATLVHQNPNIRMTGSALVDGRNHDLAGALTGAGDRPGIEIVLPATTANLLATMTAGEQAQVIGATAAPSLGTTSSYSQAQVDNVVIQARNAAQVVVTNGHLNGNRTYGDPIAGPQYVVYREGDLRINGNLSGSGLLVVNGNLTVSGTMSWTGVVVVTGRLGGTGNSLLSGGTVLGELGDELDLRGTSDVRFSRPAIDLAINLTGRYVAFNGWQELSIY